MKFKATITAISTAMLLGACSSEKELQPIRESLLVSQSLPRHADKVYAKMKSIPKHAENAIAQSYSLFSHQTALADYLLQNDYADDLEVSLELLEQRNKALLRLHFERVADEKLTEDAIRAFYAENAEKFSEYSVNVAVIKFRTTPNMSEEQRLERKALADRVANEIASESVTFNQAYAAYHNNESPPEIRLTSFNGEQKQLLGMKKGDISPVIESEGNYVIYQLLGNPITEAKPLDAVKDQIAYHLKQEYRLEEEERLAKLIMEK